jgi:hypothetical protein
MQKFSKEWKASKEEGRKALELRVAAERSGVAIVDTTVGHIEGRDGTWNTSGVELPLDLSAVRDVRPETRDAVSLEGLKAIGVPVRTEADLPELEAASAVSDSDPLASLSDEERAAVKKIRAKAAKEAAKGSK